MAARDGRHGAAILAHAAAGRIVASWTHVLHHVARSEVLYAASFDEALPSDSVARDVEADARFSAHLITAQAVAGDPSVVFPDPYGTFRTPPDVVAEVLALERELIAAT